MLYWGYLRIFWRLFLRLPKVILVLYWNYLGLFWGYLKLFWELFLGYPKDYLRDYLGTS